MSPTFSTSLRSALASSALTFVLAACGGDEPASVDPSQTAGAGGAAAAAGTSAGTGAGGPAAGSGGSPSGTAGNSSATGGRGALPAAGSGTAAPAAGGGGSSGAAGAGTGGAAGAMQPMAPPRPTECLGKPLPPRALGKSPPFAIGPEAAGLPPYWPTMGWQMQPPEMLGFDPAKLMAAADFTSAGSSTQAVLIIRHGYVALEKYVGSFGMNSTHESYSMAKSFASALIGMLIGEGKLTGTDEKICKYYPMNWDCDDMMDPRSRITIEHAMNLMTGLRWSENWRSNATGTNDAFNLSLLDTVLAREAVEEPGMRKRYSTGDPALLTGVIQQVSGMSAYDYAKSKVFDVIGASSIRWNQDSRGRTTTYAGLQANARDYAKFGYLYLNRGQWDGKQIVPADWIERTTQAAKPCEDWNQWLWHVNPPIRLGPQASSCTDFYCTPTEAADLPPEAYFAEGINGQFIFVVPSADLVIVRLGMDGSGSERWDDYARGFLAAVLGSLK